MRSSIETVTPLLLLVTFWNVDAFSARPKLTRPPTFRHHATVAPAEAEAAGSALSNVILEQLSSGAASAKEYAEMFGLSDSEAGFYGVFESMRKSGMAWGLRGMPFVLRKDEIQQALGMEASPFAGFFTMKDLEKALEDDFLDAARGSTDNRKGWKVRIM
jgi:hypothetical protein